MTWLLENGFSMGQADFLLNCLLESLLTDVLLHLFTLNKNKLIGYSNFWSYTGKKLEFPVVMRLGNVVFPRVSSEETSQAGLMIDFKLDTGAEVTAISEATYQQITSNWNHHPELSSVRQISHSTSWASSKEHYRYR